MYLYLRDNRLIRKVTNVSLDKCYRPCVGTFLEERIEPALWYKVLLLDSMFVDCDSRNVYWNIESNVAAKQLHGRESLSLDGQEVVAFFKGKDKLFTEKQCYDFDPNLDELFETTRSVITHLDPEVIDREGNALASEELLKLLHVFILPEICFHTKDRVFIIGALKEIEKQQVKVEDEIQSKERTKRNTETSLWKQRQDLLRRENFRSPQYIGTLDETFLKLLLKHIEKDLTKLNEILAETDKRISTQRDAKSDSEKERLTQSRQEQTEVLAVLETFMVAREEIKNVMVREHSKSLFRSSRIHVTDFHRIYLEVNRRLEKISKELWDLVKRKIKLSSVREAANLTLKEIDTDGSSFGYNRKKGTFEKEIDLFDPSSKPEAWTTLEEKVKTCLYNNQNGFGAEYVKFCGMIRRKCEQVQNESKLFGSETIDVPDAPPLSPETEALVNRIGNESVRRRTIQFPSSEAFKPPGIEDSQIRRQSAYSPRWSMAPLTQNTCESICKEVTKHIAEMSQRLAIELKGKNCDFIERHYINKVYVCYEQHVSNDLMPVLSELFEINYRQNCQNLSQWIERHSVELGMDSIIRGLMLSSLSSSTESSTEDLSDTEVKVPIGGAGNREECKSVNTLSRRELKNMPWDELYDRMNKQHQSVDEDFVGAIDIEPCEYTIFKPEYSSQTNVKAQSDANDNTVGNDKTGELAVENGVSEQGAMGITAVTNGILERPPPYTETDTIGKLDPAQMRHAPNDKPPEYSSLPPVKVQFYETFEKFFDYVAEEDKICSLFSKLGLLTNTIQYIGEQISKSRSKGADGAPCADDLLDVVIILLCKLDRNHLLKLYAHLNMMIFLLPDFMQGNAHEYSLVKFTMAYQYLIEKQLMHKNAKSTPDF